MVPLIDTGRLVLRPWTIEDAPAALAIFGAPGAAMGLTVVTGPVDDIEAMRAVLIRWAAQDGTGPDQLGHWALDERSTHRLVGGLSLEHAPWDPDDVRMTWQLAPSEWGHGYAVEACSALLRWAVHDSGLSQVFAVVPRADERATATAERVGMTLVREIGRQRLQVYRIRHEDLGDGGP